MNRPPAGIIALAAFFAFGATMSFLASLALLLPNSGLQTLWRLNPEAHVGLAALGTWAVALMLAVSIACGVAAVALWRGVPWGRAVALTVLAVNLAGDVGTVFYRGDWRTLIGVPIGAVLIGYLLLNGRVRAYFAPRAAA